MKYDNITDHHSTNYIAEQLQLLIAEAKTGSELDVIQRVGVILMAHFKAATEDTPVGPSWVSSEDLHTSVKAIHEALYGGTSTRLPTLATLARDLTDIARILHRPIVTAAVDAQSTNLTWTDDEGVRHTMTHDGAVRLLDKFWTRWPGGWAELEAEERAQSRKQAPLRRSDVDELLQVAQTISCIMSYIHRAAEGKEIDWKSLRDDLGSEIQQQLESLIDKVEKR